METPRTVLVVDDDETFQQRLVRALNDRGFEAVGASTVEAAIAHAERETPELAVVDLRLPAGSGLSVVRRLHELDASTRVVVLTGYGSIATALEAVRSGAVNYLSKPASIEEILAALEAPGASADAPPAGAVGSPHDFIPTLARVQWEHLERVMLACNGNVSQAAKQLGLHRRSLQRKLSKRPTSR